MRETRAKLSRYFVKLKDENPGATVKMLDDFILVNTEKYVYNAEADDIMKVEAATGTQ